MTVFVLWRVLASTQLRVGDLLSQPGRFSSEYRRNWLLHLQRMQQKRIPLKSYHYRPQGRRTIGRQKKRWREQLHLRRRDGSKGPFFDVYDNNNDRGNYLPSFFNHNQQQISCSVHGYKIVNYHNAVAEDIPLIWQKIERDLT